MLVFGRNVQVGVSVQVIKQIQEYQRLAENYFSPEEAAVVIRQNNIESFFEYWTAKEAYVKAIGCGFYKDFDSFSVKIGGTSSERFGGQIWQICQITVDKCHKACLVYGRRNENEL